jgi:pyruvate dehydrogenase E2 component (dihydrolipoamide acetyltransferase)/2-oxoglutarate dehydrogenase E2 component (dihydrolipoamide succinyltransferase)
VATKIIAPKLGMSTDPVQVVEWNAKEGEWVEKGDVILVIETEKIRNDIEAEVSGYLHIVVPEGQEAEIGSSVGFIAETKEELASLPKEAPPAESAAPGAALPAVPGKPTEKSPAALPTEGRVLISPVARKIAEEHLIDIAQIEGTGPGGRIVREDVERAVAAGKSESRPEAPGTGVYGGRRVREVIPLRGTGKTIADRMHRSLSIAAQLTVMGEIEMTEMVKTRENLAAREDSLGIRVTYTDLLVYSVARVLKELPIVNSSLMNAEVVLWEDVNIGVAVATDSGLIVPVVRNADQKTIVEVGTSVRELARRARERKLVAEDVQDGTFTVTNLGALGGGYRFEAVIINQPESAILGTGGITDRPVVREGQIVIRPIMTYYFTYDHRVMDGAVAAQFLQRLTSVLEHPGLLLE